MSGSFGKPADEHLNILWQSENKSPSSPQSHSALYPGHSVQHINTKG